MGSTSLPLILVLVTGLLFFVNFGVAQTVEDVEKLKDQMKIVMQQLVQQQMTLQEGKRVGGASGIQSVRLQKTGTTPYMAASFTERSRVCSIHNHANNINTMGLGELHVIMNGVEFRTRHNDYKLRMPSRMSKDYHATEEIPFPDVPPEVLSKATVEEQAQEMREWFKAFKDQDYSVRDYRKYFKPVMCYMEGGWTTNTDDIDEPFDSDRHSLQASTWHELSEISRFYSYSGRKDVNENVAWLPTTIMKLNEEGFPEIAQWNYRILCHSLKNDLPLDRMNVVDDLQQRMAQGKPYAKLDEESRGARFELSDSLAKPYPTSNKASFTMAIDEIMNEIPGKDNYPGYLTDRIDGSVATDFVTGADLNAAYYNRVFKESKKDAMGITIQSRSYNDQNIFMAMTSHPQISSMNYKECNYQRTVCNDIEQRWTYAIPLELVYLTPLSKWNPYDIVYWGHEKKDANGKAPNRNGRNGGKDTATAFNGTNNKLYYRTPTIFFEGGEKNKDAADTTRPSVGVLDASGTVREVAASGQRIHLPSIDGVGIIRTRYPLMPITQEGSTAWKEIKALQDVVMEPDRYQYALRQQSTDDESPPPGEEITQKKMGWSVAFSHTHTLDLTASDIVTLENGGTVNVTTEQGANHNHQLVLVKHPTQDKYMVQHCDANDNHPEYQVCFDGHWRGLLDM